MHTILVVDDDKEICKTLKGILGDEGFKTHIAQTPDEAMKKLKSENIQLILLDVWFGKDSWDGVNLLEQIKQISPLIPIIMISGHGTLELAVKAIKRGAYDFLEKPFDLDRLLLSVRHGLEHSQLHIHKVMATNEAKSWPFPLASSLTRLAATDARVLILGENGTGKTSIVKEMVQLSSRKDKSVLILEAQELNTLGNEELLGIERDRVVERVGLFEKAQGGTIILRNVDTLSDKLQKVLSELWDLNGVYRVNGKNLVPLNVRFLATAQDTFLSKAGLFFKEFFDRITLNYFVLKVLREHKEDIKLWIEYLMSFFSLRYQKFLKPLDSVTLRALQLYEWPGNITQLSNVIENAVIVATKDTLIAENFSLPVMMQFNNSMHQDLFSLSLTDARCMFEHFYISYRLSEENGNVSIVARKIGMERSALHRKIKHLNEKRIEINQKSGFFSSTL
ncbi:MULTISPECIES: sigma-54-dependent transcriptional regulator [Holospora]|uniref:Nitrogen assimilation regulatory protein NtrX n=2 Tax=Holospora TaxID=44747 RepID=A0A061JI24_9PROT|nr:MULTISPECIES: sigma-54 dependent transcriptional regulator [Holospora]ETZ05123.1 nitrogen assimilation regulatory protein NtrX [Holospora undulata HU1]GAJ45805.1 nitrogen assimilation regulatory protein NtrX [Holospora elegans E1]